MSNLLLIVGTTVLATFGPMVIHGTVHDRDVSFGARLAAGLGVAALTAWFVL